jgi:GDPmannose 4,6-dehydratase
VTKNIVAAACAIKRGEMKRLKLGNLDIARDWGAAPDYVDAMWRIMQLDNPTDLVIATGQDARP